MGQCDNLAAEDESSTHGEVAQVFPRSPANAARRLRKFIDVTWTFARSPRQQRLAVALAGVLSLTVACASGGPAKDKQANATVDPSNGLHSSTGHAINLPTLGFRDPHDLKKPWEQALANRPDFGQINDLERGDEAVNMGYTAAALSFLESNDAVGLPKINTASLQGRAYKLEGRYDLAESRFKAVQNLRPQADDTTQQEAWSIGLIELADIYRDSGRPQEAEATYRIIIAASPNSWLAKGELLDMLWPLRGPNDPEVAAIRNELYNAYDQGQAVHAADLLGVGLAALSSRTTGGFHDANMVLSDAQQLSIRNEQTWVSTRISLRHGQVFLEKYNAQEAARDFSEILKRNPTNATALASLSRVSLRLLQLRKAQAYARFSLAINPNLIDAHLALARIDTFDGHYEQAQRRLQKKILARNPANTAALAVLAAIAIRNGQTSKFGHYRDRALRGRESNPAFFTDVGEMLHRLHLYPEAHSVLQDGYERFPKDPYLQSAFGLASLHMGHDEVGRKALTQARKSDPFHERTFNTHRFFEETIDVEYQTHSVTGQQIEVRYPSAALPHMPKLFGEMVSGTLHSLRKLYQLDPGPVRIEVYQNAEHFSLRTVGTPQLGALGVCFGSVTTLVGPFGGQHNFRQTLWHEMAHVFALKLSKGRVPRWFTEGLSEYESLLKNPAWRRRNTKLLREAGRNGRLFRIADLEQGFLKAESPQDMEVAYTEASLAVEYLGERLGRPALLTMLKGFAGNKHPNLVVAEVAGMKWSQIELEFEQWLQAKLSVSGWLFEPSDQPTSLDKLYLQAKRALEQQDGDTAQEKIETLVQRGGDGVDAQLVLGMLAMSSGEFEQAKVHLNRALSFDPQSVIALESLVSIAQVQGQTEIEVQLLKTLLASKPTALPSSIRLVTLGLTSNDNTLSQRGYHRANSVAPQHPAVVAATILLDPNLRSQKQARAHPLGKYLASSREIEGFLEDSSTHADTWVLVALANEALGRPKLAAANAKRALEYATLSETAKAAMNRLVEAAG